MIFPYYVRKNKGSKMNKRPLGMRISWDELWLGMAQLISERSSCLSRKVGAVIIRDNILLAMGYNGPPRGIKHCDERSYEEKDVEEETRKGICPRKAMGFGSGQGVEYCPAEHAERNAIINATITGTNIQGSTLYLNQNAICNECAKAIIQAGIVELVMIGWVEYEPLAGRLLNEAGVKIRIIEEVDL